MAEAQLTKANAILMQTQMALFTNPISEFLSRRFLSLSVCQGSIFNVDLGLLSVQWEDSNFICSDLWLAGKPRPPFDALLKRISVQNVGVLLVLWIDIPSGWHEEEGDAEGTGLKPDMLVSLTWGLKCLEQEVCFKGLHHFLGGNECWKWENPVLAIVGNPYAIMVVD
ncbi:hypothetical protein R1sor_018562 [Riccia sorocarpa]|uniref:YjeF N-terminal domain-containing protein n=1 Tax=Riccia sorocarpa TaxID=122646 RepID=A0ABD3IDL8_9MARC